jgi:hypothetical protein
MPYHVVVKAIHWVLLSLLAGSMAFISLATILAEAIPFVEVRISGGDSWEFGMTVFRWPIMLIGMLVGGIVAAGAWWFLVRQPRSK